MNRTQLFDFLFFTTIISITGFAIGWASLHPASPNALPPGPAPTSHDDAMDWYLNPGNPLSPLSPAFPGNIMNP